MGARGLLADRTGWWIGNGVFAWLVMLFLLAPLLAIMPLAFNDGAFLHYPMPGLSLRWFSAVLSSQTWREGLANSLAVGLQSTALATVLGTCAALGLSRLSGPGAAALTAFLVAPMIAPTVIIALGLFILFSQVGLASTRTGLVLGHALLSAPFVLVTVSASLRTLDGRLLRAAASLGAAPWRAFATVTLPMILPGVLTGVLLAFMTSFDEVVVSLFIAGPDQRTLPRLIFENLRESIDPTIVVVSTLLMAVAVLVLLLMQLLRNGRAEAPR